MTMYKRILVLVLLCAGVCFSSCSSKKTTYGYNHKGRVIVSESDMYKTGERISQEEYKKQNYERQSEMSKKLMKDNEKRSKRDTPLRPNKKRSLFNSGKSKSHSPINDAVINDGVRDIK